MCPMWSLQSRRWHVPEVTASEVVDRETLKTYVKAAAQIYRETMLDDYGQLSHVKNAFRMEGSDWKSGSIYIFIMSNDGYVALSRSRSIPRGQDRAGLRR